MDGCKGCFGRNLPSFIIQFRLYKFYYSATTAAIVYYQLQTQIKMKPFDIHLILGDDNSGKQIAKLDIDFQFKPENLAKLCHLAEISEAVEQDVILKFDFTTQEGRQKECIQYFQSGLDKQDEGSYDHDLSPLQNWFQRPKKSGKLQIYESTNSQGKGRITLQYRIYKEQIDTQSDIQQISQKLKDNTFRPDLKLSAVFYGNTEIYKKNRIKLKLDYIEAKFTSQQMKMKGFLQLMCLLRIFAEDQQGIEEFRQHPLFKFFQNTQEIQLKLKMASIRKMLELYQIGITEENTIKERKKDYPEIIKGLFKEDVKVSMIYANNFGFIAKYQYQSEAVLIRMLSGIKKYSKYFD